MLINAKKMTKMVIAAIAVMVITVSTWGGKVFADTAVDTTPIDFVLVLDCSRTMYTNDPERWTPDAAEAFIDLIGEENVRISVISMGPKYGSDAYPIGQADRESDKRIKVAFPLTAATDEAKEEAKEAIKEVTGHEYAPGETMTPIGYALQAACEVLEDGDSADNHAAIILLSDGQVEGQTDYVNKGSILDYRSIDDACDNAAEHDWKIYCMELNYEGLNREGNEYGEIACHQMRENIPSRTGTDPFEVTGVKMAHQKLLDIYNSYIKGIIKTWPIQIPSEQPFTVEEMTAEQTIILNGDVAEVESVGLISPDGTKTETYLASQGNVREKLRKITYGNKSIVVKMVMPQEGEWTLVLKGKGGAEELQCNSISLNQMSLVLDSDLKGSDNHVSGEAVQFNAHFEYADIRYESADFFDKYPAVLHAGDQTVKMESAENGYECSYQFPKMGTYPTYVQVDAPFFKDGYIRSGELTFNVDNTQTKAKGDIPEQTCGVKESTKPLDLSKYFDAGDGDDLTYAVKKSARDDFEYDLSDDILVLKAHDKSKVFELTATASDGSGEKGAEQKIVFRVANKPLELHISNQENLDLVLGTKNIPGILLKMIRADKDSDTAVIKWSDYFSDPDGAEPEIRILEDENKGIVNLDENDDGIVITALKAGEAKYTIIGIDGNADDVFQVVYLDIASKNPFKGLLIILGIIVACGGIAAFLAFGGRKIYGTWEVSCNGVTEYDVDIPSRKHGKGTKVPVNSILSDLGMDGSFSKACLKAGNQFGKKVFISNFGNMDMVFKNDIEVEDFRKKKEIEIKRGTSLTLNLDVNSVTFTRVS